MALPVGVTTFTVTAGVPVSHTGAPVKAFLSIEPSAFLVHTATGTPLVDFLEELSINEGVAGQLTLPHTDQDGFQDENGNAYKNWYYTARLSYSTPSKSKNKPPKIKVFQSVTGQDVVDLDALPSGAPALPYIAPIATVTSVNGRTGPVTIEDADLPARLSEGELTATILEQVSVGVAPKLDSAKAAVTYAPKIQPGSDLVRSMVGAAVMSSLPTLTASSTAPAAFTRTLRVESTLANFWSGFRVSGAPMMVVSAPGAHPRGAMKTTPAANTWGGCARLEFDMEDDGFAFTIQATAGARFKIWVNERPHAAAMQLVSSVSGVSGTGTHHVTVDFGSRSYRRIVFEWAADSSAPSNFQGLRVKPTAAIFPPSIPSPRFMVIHDSYGYGVGATDVGDAYPIQLGRLLGFADIWNFTAVPSTGVLKGDSANSYGAYNTRFATDVLPYLRAGDVCLYSGSVNDGAEAAGAVQTQAIADLTALMAAKPDTRFIVASPIYTTVPLASHARLRDEMAAAAAALGLPFVNLMDTTLGLWTGTGTVDAPAGDGNSDFYTKNVGGFHPTTAGALAIAREEARQVAAALGQAR